jgi:hypothetical protein
MEEKQISAVEWLENEFQEIFKEWGGLDTMWIKRFEQAKQMERQQIMTAFTQGDIFGSDYFDGVNITEENYYNKTFKSE